MQKNEFNAIVIDDQLDFPRIQKLLTIGFIMSIIAFIIDINLASSLKYDYGYAFAYQKGLHFCIFGVIGVIVVALQGLSYFGIYRLMASSSPRYAHHLRSDIICYLVLVLVVNIL